MTWFVQEWINCLFNPIWTWPRCFLQCNSEGKHGLVNRGGKHLLVHVWMTCGCTQARNLTWTHVMSKFAYDKKKMAFYVKKSAYSRTFFALQNILKREYLFVVVCRLRFILLHPFILLHSSSGSTTSPSCFQVLCFALILLSVRITASALILIAIRPKLNDLQTSTAFRNHGCVAGLIHHASWLNPAKTGFILLQPQIKSEILV